MHKRSILPESCYISPVCIDSRADCCLTVHSLKLDVHKRDDLRAAGRVLVVLVADNQVVHEGTFDVTPHTKPLLRVKVPSHLLHFSGLITGYVVLCDKHGRISNIVDSGQVLVFPKDAAQEVRSLFDKVIMDTKQFFGQQEPMLSTASAQQAGTMLSRAAKSLTALVKTSSSSTATEASRPTNPAQGSSSSSRANSSSYNSAGAASKVDIDAATLYAYEHFMLPFVRHWAALLKSCHTLLQPGCSNLDAAKADTLATRLLHFMLDNEMWACSVLLLENFPSMAALVLQVGLELPADFCDPIILERLRAALPAVRAAPQQLLLSRGYEASRLGHQQQGTASAAAAEAAAAGASSLRQQQQQQGLQVLHELYARSRYSVMTPRENSPLPNDVDASTDDESSYESASEILRQLSALQKARAEEHEGLQGYLQPPLSLMRPSRSTSAAAAAAESEPATAPSGNCGSSSSSSSQHDGTGSIGAELGGAAEGNTPSAAADEEIEVATVTVETATSDAAAAAAETSALLPAAAAAAGADDAAPGSNGACDSQQSPAAAAETGHAAGPAAAGGSNKGQQLGQHLQAARQSVADAVSSDASSATCEAAPGCSGSKQVLQPQQWPVAGAEAAAAAYDDCGSSKVSNASNRPAPPTFVGQAGSLACVALSGFPDQCIEQSYLVFKNHTNLMLDATAGVICGGMLAATTTRSVDVVNDPEGWGKLAVLIVYGLFFFFPYILMHYRCQQFLRYRETMLVFARCVTAMILIVVAAGLVPRPDAWVAAVVKTLSLHLQNAFILPSCQQLRVRAAGIIAAVHWASDAAMLGLGQPLSSAFLQSSLIQMCAVLVSLAWDVWCRYRFVQRYLGVSGGSVGGLAAPAGMQQGRAKAGAAAGGGSSSNIYDAACTPVSSNY